MQFIPGFSGGDDPVPQKTDPKKEYGPLGLRNAIHLILT